MPIIKRINSEITRRSTRNCFIHGAAITPVTVGIAGVGMPNFSHIRGSVKSLSLNIAILKHELLFSTVMFTTYILKVHVFFFTIIAKSVSL